MARWPGAGDPGTPIGQRTIGGVHDVSARRPRVPHGDYAVMAIVNRTPDSFFDRGATFAEDAALRAVDAGGRRGRGHHRHRRGEGRPGRDVDVAEELRRRCRRSSAVRARFPDVVISHRHLAGRGGARGDRRRRGPAQRHLGAAPTRRSPRWPPQTGAGLVCSHAGGLAPRTRPHRVAFADVVADVVAHRDRRWPSGRWRWGCAGTASSSTRRTTSARTPGTRWRSPAASASWSRPAGRCWSRCRNKDFIGETLDLPVGERLEGTLAATAVSAWLGARVFRAHQVRADPPGPGHGGGDPGRPPARGLPARTRLSPTTPVKSEKVLWSVRSSSWSYSSYNFAATSQIGSVARKSRYSAPSAR